jgi:hypothetical protein
MDNPLCNFGGDVLPTSGEFYYENRTPLSSCGTFTNGATYKAGYGNNFGTLKTWFGAATNTPYFALNGVLVGTTTNATNTRIINFTPDDNVTVTGPNVFFEVNAYVNQQDIGTISGIKITLHNIDQNVLLLGALSPSDIYLYEGNIDTAGFFNFSTTTVIGNGNYRLEACLERSYFGGWIVNPFANVVKNDSDCKSHQFVVGTSTFIGTVSQNGYSILNELANGTTTATSTAQAANCYFWFPSNFNPFKCGTFLFVPDGNYLNVSLKSFRDGVLTRVPWGYVNRFFVILTSSSSASLPTFTVPIHTGSPHNLATTTFTIDTGDMLTGANALLTETRDPFYNKNIRDIVEPFVQLSIALGVLFTILIDIIGSHKHGDEPQVKQDKKT